MDVAVGDFNGDSRPDIIVAGSGEARGFIYVPGRFGTPPFGAPQLIVVDANATSTHVGQGVLVADFNNDGNLDVALSRQYSGVTVSPGNGDGTFAPPVEVITDVSAGLVLWPLRLTAYNLDGDNDVDVVLTDGRNQAIYAFRNDGNFNFVLIEQFPITGVIQLDAGDLNGDGLDDLAWGKSSVGVVVSLNNGASGFHAPVNYILNRDDQGGPETPYDVMIQDIDLDGDNDILVTHPDSPTGWLTVMANSGDGVNYSTSFHSLPVFAPNDLVAADFDGDQRIDLATLDVFNVITFIRNETVIPGQFAFSFPYAVTTPGTASRRLVCANYDADCDHDLIAINQSPSMIALVTNLSEQLNQCTVADFDYDGQVSGDDLTFLLSEWGKPISPADLDMSGRVEGWDLAFLIWGWSQPVPE